MAGSLGDLIVRVGADIDGFHTGMQEVSRTLNGIGRDADSMSAGFQRVGSKMSDVGTRMSVAITGSLTGIAGIATTVFSGFEREMNRVSALGDITGASLERLKGQAMQLGADTQFSARQAAQGMGELAASGFNAQQIFEAMPAVLALAASGELEVGRAAEISSNIMAGFGIAAKDVGPAIDVIAKAAAAGSLSVGDLGEALKFVGPIAKTAGVGFQEVTAAITLLSNAGIKGEQGGTGLRGFLATLLDPSVDAAKRLKELGISALDTTGKLKPLADIIEQFQKSGATAGDMFKIFTNVGATTASALINTGADALRNLTKELDNSNGAAQKMSETLMHGVGGAAERMRGSIETAAIALGNALAPAVINLAELVESLANKGAQAATWFGQLPAPVQQTAIALAGLAAAAGPAVWVLGQLITSVGTVGGAVVAGLVAIEPAMVRAGSAAAAWVAGLTGMAAASTTAGVALAALQGAAVATGVALGAVAVYKLGEGAVGWYKATKDLSAATSEHEKATQRLAESLAKQGVVIERGKMPLEEWEKKLAAAAIKIGDAKKATDDHAGSLQNHAAAVGTATKAVDGLTKAYQTLKIESFAQSVKDLDEAQRAYDRIFAAFQNGKATIIDMQRAWESLHKAQKDAGVSLDGLDKIQAGERLAKNLALAVDQTELLRQGAARATEEFNRLSLTSPIFQRTAELMNKMPADLAALNAALREFPDLDAKMNSAVNTYNVLLSSGIATRSQLLQSEKAALEEIFKFYEREGIAIPAEEKARYAELEKLLGQHVANQDQHLKKFREQVSTIWTDFSKGVADAVLSGKDFFDKLGTITKDFGKAAIRLMTETAMEPVEKALNNLMDKTVGKLMEVVGNLISKGVDKLIGLITKPLDSLVEKFSDALASKVSSKISDAVLGTGATAGKAAGGVGGAGGAVGSAASGLSGVVNMITGAATAISSIVGNFQMMGMSKDLGEMGRTLIKIENITRDTLILQNAHLPKLTHIWEYFWNQQLGVIAEMRDAVKSGVELLGRLLEKFAAVPALAAGGIVTRPTLAFVGEGGESEAVIPLSMLGSLGGGIDAESTNRITGAIWGSGDGVVAAVDRAATTTAAAAGAAAQAAYSFGPAGARAAAAGAPASATQPYWITQIREPATAAAKMGPVAAPTFGPLDVSMAAPMRSSWTSEAVPITRSPISIGNLTINAPTSDPKGLADAFVQELDSWGVRM